MSRFELEDDVSHLFGVVASGQCSLMSSIFKFANGFVDISGLHLYAVESLICVALIS